MPLIEAFKPDILVSQLGIDTHFSDPLTHLHLSVQGFIQAVRVLSGSAQDGWRSVEVVTRLMPLREARQALTEFC